MTAVTDDVRAAIAAALDSVDGVHGVPSAPPVIAPGMAWPNWVSTAWVNECARERTWEVLVALPGTGDATTVDAADPMVEAAGQALWDIGHIDLVEPVLLTAGNTGDTLPALRYRLVTP